MKLQNLKRKAQMALATVSIAALSAPAMAEETNLLSAVKTELGGYKAEVLALGVVVVGIAIAFAVVRIGKRGANAV